MPQIKYCDSFLDILQRRSDKKRKFTLYSGVRRKGRNPEGGHPEGGHPPWDPGEGGVDSWDAGDGRPHGGGGGA